jgi:beta-fructofuranosidase
MYIVGTKDKRSCISIFESWDLINWDFKGYALTSGDDAPINPAWGAMESPYIVRIDDEYYLFVTYTDCCQENYHNTLVFMSKDPTNFGVYNGGNGGAIPITQIFAHAPEIIKVGDEYFITTCGWNDYKDVPNKGAVSIAPLKWKDN